MDYRDLLKRYMRMVGHEEGTTFVGCIFEGHPVPFTSEEIAVLNAIDAEGLEDDQRERDRDAQKALTAR